MAPKHSLSYGHQSRTFAEPLKILFFQAAIRTDRILEGSSRWKYCLREGWRPDRRRARRTSSFSVVDLLCITENCTATITVFTLALCGLPFWLLIGMEVSKFDQYHGYLSSVYLRLKKIYPSTWCLCVCVCVCVCVCACARACVFPSTLKASPDWNKTNVMPEIRPTILRWGNYSVSSTFVTTS